MIMSEYYKSLLPVAATRYLAKLRVLGLEETDDPYWTANSFVFALPPPPPPCYANNCCLKRN